MAAVSEEMLIDAVDQNDVPTGVVPRHEVFKQGVNFRVAHDVVFNSRGELLVQQLATTRTRHTVIGVLPWLPIFLRESPTERPQKGDSQKN